MSKQQIERTGGSYVQDAKTGMLTRTGGTEPAPYPQPPAAEPELGTAEPPEAPPIPQTLRRRDAETKKGT